MQFINVIVFLTSSAFAQSSSNPSNTMSSAMPSTSITTDMQNCASQRNCDLSDMSCRAACAGVPNPTAAQMNATTSCVAACDKTNVQEYTICSQKCISDNYYSNSNNPSQSSRSGASAYSSAHNVQSPAMVKVLGAIVGASLLASL